MIRFLLSFALIAFPLASAAAPQVSLGDLDVPSDHVASWYPASEAESHYVAAQGWPEYDATCANSPCPSGRLGFRDAPGNPMGSCPTANPAHDGGKDWAALDCMMDNAPDSSVIYVPSGTYDMGDQINQIITVNRSNVALRCESPATTHLRAKKRSGYAEPTSGRASCNDSDFGLNENCGAIVFSMGSRYEGAATSWTSGFAEDATTVRVASTAGLQVGGYIMLEAPRAAQECPVLIPESPVDGRNSAHALGHIAKITAINGPDVTIDRGLRLDYSCASTTQARPYNPVRGIGLDSCHLVSDSQINQDDMRDLPFIAFGAGTAESWATNNTIERGEARMVSFNTSVRNWLQGNQIRDYGRIDTNFNTSGVNLGRGSVDNVIENNAFEDFVVGVYANQGPEGSIIAYNYMRFGTPPNNPERAIMNHGLYTREMLIEGNDTDGHIITADHWWGSNGGRIMAYRNRVVGSGSRSSIVVNRDKPGDWPLANRLNWIGNTASYYFSDPNCASGFPGCLNRYHDMDGDGGVDSAPVKKMHIEKNIFRNTSSCSGDPTPGRCGFHLDTPRAETSCGTASGPGDCSGGVGDNAGGAAAPASWQGDTVPTSMYRSTAEPRWWCAEACSWSDVHSGIGAWGDNFAGSLCKLPAQILLEGGTCTLPSGTVVTPPPSGGGGGGSTGGGGTSPTPPTAPYLLP